MADIGDNLSWSITYDTTFKNLEPNQPLKDMEILRAYKRHLKTRHRKPRTINTYYNSAKHFIETTSITSSSDINEKLIQDYLIYLNEHYKHNTISGYIVGMDKLLDYLDLSEFHVTIINGKRKRRDTIEKEDIQEILKQVKQVGIIDYLMLRFITDFDARNHEITEAKWSWIKGDRIYFQDCKTGDNDAVILPDLQELLNYYRKNIRPMAKKGVGSNPSIRIMPR